MKNKSIFLTLFISFSIITAQPSSNGRDLNLEYVATIENLNNEGFSISGDRMYTIYPGTDPFDDISLLSIVDLTTLTVIATYGPVNGSYNNSGSPNRIDVFDHIAVVDGLLFLDVSDDEIVNLGVGIESAFGVAGTMDTYKKIIFYIGLYRA